MHIQFATSQTGFVRFTQHGKHRFDLTFPSGRAERLRYVPHKDEFQHHRLGKDVYKLTLGGSLLTLCGDEGVVVGKGQEASYHSAYEAVVTEATRSQ